MSEEKIDIEVCYALPTKQQIIPLKVDIGTTIYDAAKLSGIESQFAELDLETAKMGVFGKVVAKPKQTAINEHERIEIYRPLIADPKEVRKARAAKAKAEKADAKTGD
jgi:putative ubiquitin-RnfH superfamily antitoxin RatB of RatAB toxin-antitoxin module